MGSPYIYMAHPVATSPSTFPLASTETDASKASSSSSLASTSGGSRLPLSDSEAAGILENGFLTPPCWIKGLCRNFWEAVPLV